MNEKVKAITDKLEAGLDELYNSDKYKEYLAFSARFHKYSFNNCLLILMQRPDATRVAGIGVWNNAGRKIKKGEHGIHILAPNTKKIKINDDEEKVITTGFRIAYVFDESQTEGEKLPEIGVDELQGSNNIADDIKRIITQISPVIIEYTDITNGSKGYFSYAEQKICIKQGMSDLQTAKTMIHETAHAMLHKPDDGKTREQKEVEAESVAFIVSTYFGLDTSDYSFGYIASWERNKDLLKASLKDIQKCSNEIITEAENILR